MTARCVLGLLFVLALTYVAQAQVASPPAATAGDLPKPADLGEVMLIVDFSNSMMQKVDGRRKYETAVDATQQLLGTLSKVVTEGGSIQPVGLMLYGHREPVARRACNDIQIVVPPGPVNDASHRNRIMEAVRRAQPRGMTPIAASLRLAAEALNYRQRPVTLILVSDGVESCQADPCAEARLLREQGVRLIAHVVGYAVKPDEFRQLKCIADATGGMSVEAPDAPELKRGMGIFVDAIKKEADDRLTGPLAIDVVDSAGRPVTAAEFDTAAEILVETSGRDAQHLPVTGETQTVKMRAAPYRVRLQGQREYAAVDVDVRSGEGAHAKLNVSDGKLVAVFKPAAEAPPFPTPNVVWQVNRGDVNVAAASATNPSGFDLVLGRYSVAATIAGVVGTGDVRILPGATTNLEILPQPPFARLAVRIEPPQPSLFGGIQIPLRIRVVVDTPAGELELSRGADAVDTYVPPGEVRIPWNAGGRAGELRLTVPAEGASRSESLPLPSVEWSVEWNGGSVAEPFVWVVEELLDGSPTGQREMRTDVSRIAGTIPPGSYRVTVTRGAVETSSDITVLDGLNEKKFILRERL
jgi:hypothetical protein